jgi:predicted secreted protein with PEFG-CTERM motif
LTVISTLTVTSAYAQGDLPPACAGCGEIDPRMAAEQFLAAGIPISIWTDKTEYDHDDVIMVTGKVANVVSGIPATLTITSPLNNIVNIAQLDIAEDGSFETTISTAGQSWKYNGAYKITANYGSNERSNSAQIKITGLYEGPGGTMQGDNNQCDAGSLAVDDQCVPFSISGGMVTSATLNIGDKSIVINIDSEDDGTLTINPSKAVQDGIFLVLVDGEEWDDAEIVDNNVTIMFPAGTEQIEIFGTFLIPEFGTIAAMILAVAIISIIAISARSKLSIMPKY